VDISNVADVSEVHVASIHKTLKMEAAYTAEMSATQSTTTKRKVKIPIAESTSTMSHP
jgi:hypothetical protein